MTDNKVLPYSVPMMKKAIERACEQMGGQAALARVLGIKPPTVNQWVKDGRPVPVHRCPGIEQATSGAVTCEELRPDVNWSVLRQPKPESVRPAPLPIPDHQQQEAAR